MNWPCIMQTRRLETSGGKGMTIQIIQLARP